MKVCFETFGCRLNRAEALEDEAAYLAAGWMRTEKHSEADLVVVRGCSVTARAQRDCEKLIDHLKRRYPALPVRVVGCLEKGKIAPSRQRGRYVPPPPTEEVATRTARAYLKVQDGCAGKCTFCIVPKFRGEPVSVPFADVLAKAHRFVDAGYRELVVTGCNLSLYLSEGKRLADLVAALAESEPDARVRLGSVEPGAVAQDLIAAMAEHANVCRFLHLAVQSGSDRVLKLMNRPYARHDVLTNLELLDKLMPTAGLGGDFMSGFPGETEGDHLNSMSLVKNAPFSKLHVFPYSERPGTIAAGLPRPVPKLTRQRRSHELAALGDEKRRKFAKTFVGKEVEIVVESDEQKCGWTGEYLWCSCSQPHSLRAEASSRKGLARMRVLEAHGGHLKGFVV